MALKAIEEINLQRVGLIKFFEHNKAHYQALAQFAFDYTAKILEPTGLPVRPDDVAGHLSAAMEVDKLLTDYRNGHNCAAAYWVRYFTDLVIERLWGEMTNG
jgi:hypothetical protein